MKRIRQIDYECKVNERVWWPDIKGNRFEGTITSWDKDKQIAFVQMDDGTIKKIEC